MGHSGYPLFGYNHEILLCLLVNYVTKLSPKTKIKKWLQSNPDKTFLDMIRPSDIALTILLIKNGKELWISEYKNKDNTGSKVKALLNSESQKERAVGENLWSAEGMEYFTQCKMNWDRMYADGEHW